MFSSPANSRSSHSRPAARFIVLWGNAQGDAPTLADETDALEICEIIRTAGGRQIDAAKFRVNLKQADIRLVDLTVPVDVRRQLEVRLLDQNGEPTELVFWGMLAGIPQRIDARSETIDLDARIDKHLFGKPLQDVPYYNWDGSADLLLFDLPLVFNPEIDEQIEPNRTEHTRTDDEGGYSEFLHPESLRTAAARNFQTDIFTVKSWTVTDAVLMLCWHLNPDEEFITNPKRDELETDFAGIDADGVLKNVKLDYGKYLPELLDDLLRPWGYSWFLEHSLNNGARKTQIRFFKRGEGPLVSVQMQRPGETIDARRTNLHSLAMNYNVVELANKITVLGEFVQRECTFALKKGWPIADDAIDIYDLERGEGDLAAEKPYVWRKWVLNEAADYNGTRPEITDPEDLAGIFGEAQLVRRRRFHKCLSLHADIEMAESNGILVEWWDQDADGAVDHTDPHDPGWLKVKWPYSVLHKECGILFEGPIPPEELESADEAYVRVTAVIVGDHRVKGEAARQSESPNPRDIELVLNVHDKFHDRALDASSVFSGQALADTIDEWDKAQKYAEKIRDIEDSATVATQLLLDGADHPEYQIGKLVDKVDGRNLILNANSPLAGPPRRLQIVGLVWRLDGGQHLDLLMETYDPELSDERRGLIA